MGSCPLNCGAETLMTLTFWELNDCVQWYSVSLDSRCFTTVPHSWWTSCSESGFIRAAFSSWDSELFSDAILSVTVVRGGRRGRQSTPPAGSECNLKLLFYLFKKKKLKDKSNYFLNTFSHSRVGIHVYVTHFKPALFLLFEYLGSLAPLPPSLPASSCSCSLLLRLA